MRRTLDELLTAINGIVGEENTDDAVIGFIEDLTDTINEMAAEVPDQTAEQAELDRVKAELTDYKLRYKQRFFGDPVDEDEDPEIETEAEDKPDGLTITTKDIFKKEDK